MSALPGRKALVRVTGAGVAFTNEAMTGNVARTIYTITNTAKNLWDPAAAITVQTSPDGTTWTTQLASTYTLNRLVGQVTFGAARASGTQVRASGTYLPLSTVAGCKQYSYTIAAADIDTSDFAGAIATGVKSRLRGLFEVSGSLSNWYQNDPYFANSIIADTPIVIEHFSNNAGTFDLRVWAMLDKAAFQAAVDGAQEQSVDWQGTQDIDGNCAAIN